MVKVAIAGSDGQVFVVENDAAMMSLTLKHLMDDVFATDDHEGREEQVLPVPNVDGRTLKRVLEYCERYVEASRKSDEDVKSWDADFIRELVSEEEQRLYDVVLAANYLNVSPLLDLTCQHIASMIKGKTSEQIRDMFHIDNDMSPEETEATRREFAWVFE